MKKGISIFLLLIMLVVGAHPVLAMHFCAGELYSVGVLSNETGKPCCKDMEMPQREDDFGHTAQNIQEHHILPSHKNCCDTRKAELSTDDYQVQQSSLNNLLPSFENVWTALNALIPAENNGTAGSSGQYFPPGSCSWQNADLLTFICIYRI